jgi:hypothetical protein
LQQNKRKNEDVEVQKGVVAAASEFCRAEGQSVNVIVHVSAVFVGVCGLSKASRLGELCGHAVVHSMLPAAVSSVLAAWQKTAPKVMSKKTAAVPLQGQVQPEQFVLFCLFFFCFAGGGASVEGGAGGHARESSASSNHCKHVSIWCFLFFYFCYFI